MRVRFRGVPTSVPPHEARFVQPAQIFLTVGQELDAHALSVYDGVVFVLIVDDCQTPSFLPRVLFDVVDTSVCADWMCNVFPTGPVQLVVGPAFIAKDLASYGAMVDHDAKQQDELWKRTEYLRRVELVTAIQRALATNTSDDEIIQILRAQKERGLTQQAAYDALESMRSSHAEHEMRILDVMDIVSSYSVPSRRVWPQPLDV